MASHHVLSIPPIDSNGETILVDVISNGKNALDVRLLATEGSSPFITKIKQSSISKYLVKNSPVSSAQWESILRIRLLQQRVDESTAELVKNLETVASVLDSSISLIFRKNISGIHQRLGELTLSKDENQEIDTIAWALTAVTRGDMLEEEILDLKAKFEEQGTAIKQLNAQLDDLITAKKEHEESLLEKFRELLNAKKLKIRDQQRLLATAKVNKGTAEQVQATRSPSATRAPASSRPGKRKRKQKTESISPPSDSEGSGSENAAIEEVGPVTPDKSDRSDLDATDEDLEPMPPARPNRTGLRNKGKVIEDVNENMSINGLPPRRELPFAKGAGKKQETSNSTTTERDSNSKEGEERADKAVSQADDDDDDDDDAETSDDEL